MTAAATVALVGGAFIVYHVAQPTHWPSTPTPTLATRLLIGAAFAVFFACAVYIVAPLIRLL